MAFTPYHVPMSSVLRRFGVTSSNPATLLTSRNDLELFVQPQPPHHTNLDQVQPQPFDGFSGTADGYGLLGQRAMPRMLLTFPYTGFVSPRPAYFIAGGTLTTPLSASGAGVNVVMNQNYFKAQQQSIVTISDTLVSITPPAPLIANTFVTWSLLYTLLCGSLNRPLPQIGGSFTLTIGNAVYQGTTVSVRPEFSPIVSLSLGAQFSGSVSGIDQFRIDLQQLELQVVGPKDKINRASI